MAGFWDALMVSQGNESHKKKDMISRFLLADGVYSED